MKRPKLDWFLCVAENHSISKAAEQLFASQQSVSAYVKRLENFYHVTLFQRAPGFELTEAGEILYRNAKKIVWREASLREQYEAVKQNRAGRIRFGLTIARAQVFLPKIIPEYQALYPGVVLTLCEESTVSLEKHLRERRIDLYLGKNISTAPTSHKEYLTRDRLFLIATDHLIKQHLHWNTETIAARAQDGVFLRELSDLPFVTINPDSKISQHIDIYCHQNQIELYSIIQASNTPLMIELCRRGYGAGLCLENFLLKVLQCFSDVGEGLLHVFPILDEIGGEEIVMVDNMEQHQPKYFTDFKAVVRKAVRSHQFLT